MKIIFAGTPEFAASALAALLDEHEVIAVLTQPDRPAGRGMQLSASPVKQLALQHGITVLQPVSLKGEEVQQQIAALNADVMVVAAYGLILPKAVLEMPRFGCLNIHASLLPRWRGAAPIQRAILAGDSETGITIMQMEAGLDTGPMLLAEALPIGPMDTAATLHNHLAEIGARLVLRALAENPLPRPQPEDGVTYAPKLTREDGRIDWTQSATAIDRRIRAFEPWPGTFSTLDRETLKILSATPAKGSGLPGTVLDAKLTIACGTGAIRLIRVQLPGRQAMDADALLRGRPIPPGTVLG